MIFYYSYKLIVFFIFFLTFQIQASNNTQNIFLKKNKLPKII